MLPTIIAVSWFLDGCNILVSFSIITWHSPCLCLCHFPSSCKHTSYIGIFSSMQSWKIRSLFYNTIFLIYDFNVINFSLWIVFSHSTHFDKLNFYFHSFQNTFEFPLTCMLFRNMLFHLQVFGYFPAICMLLILNLFCYENILCIISILSNLVRCVLWLRMWCFLMIHVSLRRECILLSWV